VHEKLDGSTRRELEDNLLDIRKRFDRVLEEWGPDEKLRELWREYIQRRLAFALTPRGKRAIAAR
jgi:hypothetical protein